MPKRKMYNTKEQHNFKKCTYKDLSLDEALVCRIEHFL